ncbi:hypothetical protein CBM2625_U60009 [Cupriavidus taiwanensis]|nr:hypothetical protein CBM2625_U60009 [Cupriavidus taiwanensis]SPA57674.1 hypothetical protein CBM2638_U20008 [Cupriavidus taiwanensis]
MRSFANLRGYPSSLQAVVGLCCRASRYVGRVAAEQRLDDASALVGQRDRRAVVSPSCNQLLQSDALWIGLCR